MIEERQETGTEKETSRLEAFSDGVFAVALPHLRSAFSLLLLLAKCGVHETIKGRSYVRQCAS